MEQIILKAPRNNWKNPRVPNAWVPLALPQPHHMSALPLPHFQDACSAVQGPWRILSRQVGWASSRCLSTGRVSELRNFKEEFVKPNRLPTMRCQQHGFSTLSDSVPAGTFLCNIYWLQRFGNLFLFVVYITTPLGLQSAKLAQHPSSDRFRNFQKSKGPRFRKYFTTFLIISISSVFWWVESVAGFQACFWSGRRA